MRILHLLSFPLYGSGSGYFVRSLANKLTQNGHQVAIACPESRKIPGIKVYNIKLPFMAAYTGHPEHPKAKLYSQLSSKELHKLQQAFQEGIFEAIFKFKPQIIHVNHASTLSWIANYIKTVFGIHYIVTSHNTDVMNAVLDKRYINLTEDALNRADFITALSEDNKSKIIKIFGRKRSLTRKIRIIPNGVDLDELQDDAMKMIDRKFHTDGKKIVLFCGKLTPIKGIEYLIAAASRIHGEIFIVGDGDYRKTLEKEVKKKKISNVKFLGYFSKKEVPLLRAFYKRANVSVVPSTISEGIPFSVLESLAAGTPVVGSNIGGIPMAIKNNQTGFLVKPKNSNILAETINQILDNPKLEKRLGKKAKTLIKRSFDWNVISRRFEFYYDKAYRNSIKSKKTKIAWFIDSEEYQLEKELLEEKQVGVNDYQINYKNGSNV